MFVQVLFPLLDKLSGSASTEKDDTGGNILIHHSRNTAHKQWAETQVRSERQFQRISDDDDLSPCTAHSRAY